LDGVVAVCEEVTVDFVKFANHLDAEFRASCARLKRDEPWFGQFTLQSEGKARTYKVGAERLPDERIVDWRHPLARAYYDAEPGEEFELDHRGFANVSGVVESQTTLTAQARRVRKIEQRNTEGRFELSAGEFGFEPNAVLPRGPTQAEGLPDVLALLTPAQYRLITASRNNPVIIQGRAGSGKTTVALYRVAWLAYAADDASDAPVDPGNVLIVMFNRALSTFVRSGLKALNLQSANLDTFHGWALDEIRRSYRGSIEIDTSARPGRQVASQLKKQLGMIPALEAFVARQETALEKWLHEKLKPYGGATWIKEYRQLTVPVVRRLVLLRSQALAQRDAARGVSRERLTQVHLILETAVRRMTQYKEELLKFLADSELLAPHLPHASQNDLETLANFQKGLQGDGGSERRPGTKVAFEDLALLLRLIQLKNGGFPDKLREEEVRVYDHLVIDEAQDFGAVELTALLASVRARTGVTIVGDVNQKIVPDADFIGWDALAAQLGVDGAAVTHLEVVHRSTGAIMRVADSVIDEHNSGAVTGPLPTLMYANTPAGMVEQTAELVRAAHSELPTGHICVVCKAKSAAESVQRLLADALADLGAPVRLGHNKGFVFAAGVTVTNARQVKGLEFDTVIVFDPSERDYPVSADGKRALYMVLTRAKERLQFVASQSLSPLLDAAISQGFIEVRRQPSVPPVEFAPEDDDPF
jgi:DNA helicase-2/ATP-dependent DNA helicase PcrA